MLNQEQTTEVNGVKVTFNPSEQIVKAASKDVTVTDSLGRVIRLKKPSVLSQYRIVEALGDSAQNQVYMGMVLPLIFVQSINGESVAFPMNKGEVEALIKRLDEEGIAAVMAGVQANFKPEDPEVQTKKLEA